MRFSASHNPTRLPPGEQRSAFRLSFSAFTVIEMLIVVSIAVLLVAAAVTKLRPALESRRTREAARALNAYLSSARNQAMETGRPCGVMLRCFKKTDGSAFTPPFVMMCDQCEVPSCYCGDTEQSTASVTYTSPTLTATLCSNDSPDNLLRLGDTIQFGCQGPTYSIVSPTPYDASTLFVIKTGTSSGAHLHLQHSRTGSALDRNGAIGVISRLPLTG